MNAGSRIIARVVEVRDNGIYLRHDGRSGLISVVELTWDETKRPVPAELATPGDDLEVLVMGAHDDGFSASLKRLTPEDDPRRHEALTDGSVLAASVRAIRPFGVFVDLSIGLVARVDCPETTKESFEVGQPLQVVVTDAGDALGKVTVRVAQDDAGK